MEQLMLQAEPIGEMLPYVLVDQPALDLTRRRSASMQLSFSSTVWQHDLYLVIDLYSTANPVHPAGHVGWWKWPLSAKGDLPVRIVKTAAGYNITFDGHDASESWTNPDYLALEEPVLSVHIVLRPVISDAICYEDVLYLYTSAEARKFSKVRQGVIEAFEAESHSIPSYGWPDGCRVHIVATNIFERDAIGNGTIALSRLFRANGIACQLYADRFDPALRGTILHTPDVLTTAAEDDVLLVHFSILEPWLPYLVDVNCRKLLYFHNITPSRFLQVYDAEYATHCTKALAQMKYLRGFDAVLANSAVSARVLDEWLEPDSEENASVETNGGGGHNGHGNGNGRGNGHAALSPHIFSDRERKPSEQPLEATICPPMVGIEQWQHTQPEPLELPSDTSLLLYVGRVAPHKRIEDLLALFAKYYELDPQSALLIVGGRSFSGYTGYLRYLLTHDYAKIQARIHFLDSVTDGQLKTAYQAAKAFVTMSEHEGYCVPLVEAMIHDLPIFAYADGAVAETLAGAGRIYYRKDFMAIAADMADVLQTEWKRNRHVAEQRRRLQQIQQEADGRTIWSVLERVLFHDARAV